MLFIDTIEVGITIQKSRFRPLAAAIHKGGLLHSSEKRDSSRGFFIIPERQTNGASYSCAVFVWTFLSRVAPGSDLLFEQAMNPFSKPGHFLTSCRQPPQSTPHLKKQYYCPNTHSDNSTSRYENPSLFAFYNHHPMLRLRTFHYQKSHSLWASPKSNL